MIVLARGVGLFRRLRRCARADARLLARAIAWRLTLPVLKRVVPLPVLVRRMSRGARPGLAQAQAARRLEAIHLLVSEGGRLVVSGNCLERSLVLYQFLGEAGARPTLVMGVAPGASTVAGHAWVEVGGVPLQDATTGQYAPIVTFDPGGRASRVAWQDAEKHPAR